MTITTDQARQLSGKVYSQNSDKIGNIGQIYLDDESGQPTWVTTKTGLFGSSESFVPLEGARVEGNDVYVDFDEDKIKDAPRIDPDGSLSPQEEDELYRYYGLSDTDSTSNETSNVRGDDRGPDGQNTKDTLAAPVAGGEQTSQGDYADNDVPTDADDVSEHGGDRADMSDQTVGEDRSGPTTDDAMTRSEERLNVGTATRESGRARMRKFVTTETVEQTVPVRHEEVTLEREPITEQNADAANSGAAISEEEHEVVLHEEVPVVDKDVVAVERVKLGKETVTDNTTVSEDVRKENIDMADPKQTVNPEQTGNAEHTVNPEQRSDTDR